MSDPTPLVDHVYQIWIGKYLEKIKEEYKYDYNTTLLKTLYAESKVQLPGCPLHNNNINYYDYRDTTDVYTPSKMYLFLCVNEHVFCKYYKKEPEANIPECTLVIKSPYAEVTNSLLLTCQQISKIQAIVDMEMYNIICKYHSESDIFNLSENIKSLQVQRCSLSSQQLNLLMHKLSECNKICKIDLLDTSLGNVSSLTLSNKKSLTHLNLGETNMSAELCQSICEQLKDITHLEYLNMAENDLSQVSKFMLNKKKTFRYLNVRDTKMSAELCQSICQQLTDFTNLEYLNMSNSDLSQVSMLTLNNKKDLKYLNLEDTHMLSTLYYNMCQQVTDLESLEQFVVSMKGSNFEICPGYRSLRCDLSDNHLPPRLCRCVFQQINRYPDLTSIEIRGTPLTGCLSNFLPNNHPGLSELEQLYLPNTGLSKDDLQHLFSIIQLNKLPRLQCLNLTHNTLTGCLSSFLPDPHPGLTKLTHLHLNNTQLNKDDLQHLFSIIQLNKLPRLQCLNLTHNTLTGFLSSFLPNPHPGLRNLTYLDLRKTSLNKDDLCHLSFIAYKLKNLEELDLSDYTLTGCLSSFLADPHHGLPKLGNLHLKNTGLNRDDLRHLFNIIQLNKLPKLWLLNLAHNTLTGCLSNFLRDPHPGLPEKMFLYLERTSLNEDDLHHLFNIIQLNKLPKLRYLGLSGNTLTGCLSSFLPDPHPGLPELWEIDLERTGLNREDLLHLSHIIQTNKLPKLEKLDLSSNILTGCLSSFVADPHPLFSKLNLSNTELDRDDLQHLFNIIQLNKLPKLCSLDLSHNTLTGCLSSFLPDPHPGLHQLHYLYLSNTKLNRDDLQHLKHLVQNGKLLGLWDLHLEGNELCQVKEELRDLVETLIQHQDKIKLPFWYQTLNVWLADNDLPKAFQNQLTQITEGTKIYVHFEKKSSSRYLCTVM